MSAISEIGRWGYKNPGIWSTAQIAEQFPQYSRSHVGNAVMQLSHIEPKMWCSVGRGVYCIRPPEAEPVAAETELPGTLPEREPAWEEMSEIPDDRDLYPPFKIAVIEKRRNRKGAVYFRVKDEMGHRGNLYWDDDESF